MIRAGSGTIWRRDADVDFFFFFEGVWGVDDFFGAVFDGAVEGWAWGWAETAPKRKGRARSASAARDPQKRTGPPRKRRPGGDGSVKSFTGGGYLSDCGTVPAPLMCFGASITGPCSPCIASGTISPAAVSHKRPPAAGYPGQPG